MPSCSAFGCTNHSSKKLSGITFHRFPLKEPLRSEWVKAVGRENWQPSQCSMLCSDHFTEEQIDRSSCFVTRIRENEVPKIFKGFPSHLHSYLEEESKNKIKKNLEESPTHTNRCEIYCAKSNDAQLLCKSEPLSDAEDENNKLQDENHDSQALPGIARQKLHILEEWRISSAHSSGQTEQPCDLEMLIFEDEDSSCDEPLTITNEANKFIQKEMYNGLKRQPKESDTRITNYIKKIKTLHQSVRRKVKKISELNNKVRELEAKTLMQDEELAMFEKLKSPCYDFIYKQLCMAEKKGYSPEVKEFAVTLYSLSPRSYKYVRSKFSAILPHSRTIMKWTSHSKPNIAIEASKNNSEDDIVENPMYVSDAVKNDHL